MIFGSVTSIYHDNLKYEYGAKVHTFPQTAKDYCRKSGMYAEGSQKIISVLFGY